MNVSARHGRRRSAPCRWPLATTPRCRATGCWRASASVLRPGGAELTHKLLALADPAASDVVELAPGLGRTAAEIIHRRPRSYVGVEQDPNAAAAVRSIVSGYGHARVADAADTGLPDGSADVVVGEVMLTMQNDKAKAAIVAEATRLLRRGADTPSTNSP